MHIFLQVNKYAFIIFFIWSLESITGCHAGLLQNCQCICMLVPRIGRQILTDRAGYGTMVLYLELQAAVGTWTFPFTQLRE